MISIEEKGLLQPIVVRPLEGGFEVVAGNRRFEACRRLGWRKIACHIVELEDKEAYEASIIENVQHKTLNPIEEAEAYQRYATEYGYGGISELARRIGKSQEHVSRRVQLLSLPLRVQEAVMRRRIAPSIAQELLSLGDGMTENLAEIVVKESLTRREVRHIVRRVRAGYEADPFPNLGYLEDRRQHMIDRALSKYIVSLKLCLMRMGDALHDVEDEFFIRQILLECRMSVNRHLDSLYRLRKRTQRNTERNM